MSEEQAEYRIRDPNPPETRLQNYGLTLNEFEFIRLLRRYHFLESGRRRTRRGVLEWDGIHPKFFPCEVSDS